MKRKVFLFIVAIILLTIASTYLLIHKRASADPGIFHHIACQYPLRASNPVNGCDNSDPADPSYVVKGETLSTNSNLTK